MDSRALLTSSLILFLLLGGSAAAAAGDFVVTEQDYFPGDFFVYSGYTTQMLEQIEAENAADPNFESIELIESEQMRMDVQSKKKCIIGDFDGQCRRGKLHHMLNVTIRFKQDSTEFKEDRIVIRIVTAEETLIPESNLAWRSTVRTVTLTSWFSTDAGDEQNVEQRISEQITSSLSGSQPAQISVGDFWLVLESRDTEREFSQRENRGLWTKTASNSSELLQRQYVASEEVLLPVGNGFEMTLRVDEMIAGSDNRSMAYLSEFGYPLRIEEYVGEDLVLNATLGDYRYLKTPDPSVQQSVQRGGLCFGAFLLLGIIIITAVSGYEWRTKRRADTDIDTYADLDLRLSGRRKRRTLVSEQTSGAAVSSDLRAQLVEFYKIHNPQRLEAIDEILERMKEHEFSEAEDHLSALNESLRQRYGADLDNPNTVEQQEDDVELPESSRKLQAFIEDILDGEL